MKTFARWLVLASSLALAGMPAASVAAAARDSRAAKSSSSAGTSKSSSRKKTKRKRQSTRMRLPKAPTPDRISEIQTALARGGYYQGDPNGKWDAQTTAAMRKFQTANHLDANGKLDAPSLQKLGLGSDIAGVSAPKPVAPRICCGAPAPAAAPTPAAPAAPATSSASNSSSASGSTSRSSAAAADPQR